MSNSKNEEKEMLIKICKEHGVSTQLVNTLIKDAKKNSYSNLTSTKRRKEYLELINFYLKTNKGD